MIEAVGFPVSIAFSKDGRAFFSERVTGNLWEVVGEEFKLVYRFNVLPITGHHETGLLGIALDPNFDENEFIYAFYTTGEHIDDAVNRVVRVRVGQQREEVILDDIPAGLIHNGGILTFAPDKSLIIGVGVQNEIMEKAQDLNWLGGKILRIYPDGSIPENNPFEDSPVLSYGHRNIFGLAIERESGRLFACDVGPDKDDEINIIEGGGNYGWPNATGKSEEGEYVNPIHTYTPVITPTQSCFVDRNLYFGSFNEGTVHRLTFNDDFSDVIKDEVVYRGRTFGVVGVFYGPDKNFYITTPSKIMKIDI